MGEPVVLERVYFIRVEVLPTLYTGPILRPRSRLKPISLRFSVIHRDQIETVEGPVSSSKNHLESAFFLRASQGWLGQLLDQVLETHLPLIVDDAT